MVWTGAAADSLSGQSDVSVTTLETSTRLLLLRLLDLLVTLLPGRSVAAQTLTGLIGATGLKNQRLL